MESYSIEAVLQAVDQGFTEAMRKAANSAEDLNNEANNASSSGSKFKSMFGAFTVANVASNAIQGVIGYVRSLTSEAMDASDSLEKFASTMKFAGKSDAEIKKSTAQVKKYADDTVYDLSTIANTTAQLAANGVKDYNGLTQAAGNLNAVAGGNADTFKSVAMMLTQTVGAGKLTTENWNQMADAIPGASGKMQKALLDMGAYTGNFRDAMAKGQISAEEFTTAISQLGMTDAAKEAASSTSTFEGAIGALQANVVTGINKVIDSIGKANMTKIISDIANAATKAFEYIAQFVKFLSDNRESVKIAIVLIGSFFAAFKTMKAITAAITAVQSFSKAVKAAGGVIKAFNLTLAANPIVLLIAAILALVVGFVYLWKTSDKFRQFWYDLWEGIKKAVSSAVDAIKETWDNTKKWFGDTWDSFKQSASDAWDSIKQGASDVVTGIKDAFAAIVAPFQPLIDAAKESFNKIKEAASTIFEEIMNVVSNYFNILKNIVLAPVLFIASLISGGWDEAISNMQQVWSSIVTSAQEIWNSVATIFSTVISTITETATTMWSGFKEVLSTIWQGIAGVASSVWNGVKNFFANTWQSIQDTATNAWNGIKSGVENIWNGMASGAANAWESLKSGVSNAIDRVKNTFDGLRDINLFEIGKNIIDGLINGIQNKIQAVKDAVTNIASNITGSIKKILNIHSPSRVMAQLGMYTAQGLANGMTDGADRVANAAGILANSANPNIDIGANVAAANKSISSTIAHDINLNKGKQSATFMLNLGKQQFKAFVDDISNAQGNAINLNMQF